MRTLLGLFIVLWGGVGFAAPMKPHLQEFSQHIAPFFKTHCLRCHGAQKQRAKFSLHDLDGRAREGKNVVRWEKILEMISLGEMPPRKVEMNRYVDGCLKRNIKAGGNNLGIQSLLIVLMMSSELFFRMRLIRHFANDFTL